MKQEIKERVERIRKGEVPEGYKKTKVGIIPDEWKIGHLEDITTKKGLIRGPFGGSLKKEIFVKNGFKVYEQRNAIYKSVELGEYFIDEKKFEELRRFKVRKNDFIISCSGTIGRIFRLPEKSPMGVINQALLKITIDFDLVNLDFFQQYFEYDRFQHLIIDNTQGGAMSNLVGMDIFRKTPFPLFLIEEQQKIAEILSTWDTAIELKEKLIEEIKKLKRGLVQKLLVGKLRFKEYVTNPNLHEVKRYSKLPEEWDIKKASSIFSNISKKNNGNEQLLSATQNNGVIPRDMLDGDVMSPSGDTNSYKLVEEGNFVISLRSFQGGIEYSCYQGIISPAYTVLKNQIPICKDFYRHLFKSRLFIDRLASSVIGIRDGKQISYNDFSFMLLPYPELKEQEKIASMLNSIDNEIDLLNIELNQLKEQKRGLMQLLLTGIVRVEVD